MLFKLFLLIPIFSQLHYMFLIVTSLEMKADIEVNDVDDKSNGFLPTKISHFWKNTGLCPPDPHEESYKFLLSDDMKQNLFHIGSLPNKGITQVRIHWMLDLVQLRILPDSNIAYNFTYLDELIYILWSNNLYPGFELMGNPSNTFNDFENVTQVLMWKDLIETLALHYIDIYGIQYVKRWNFETWNEPDHHDFDNLNFTVQGFLNYFDACSEGLKRANKNLLFGGPGGSCRIPSVGKSPMCWALLEHCANGKNFFTGRKAAQLDFISFHKKGNGSTYLILKEEIETIQYIEKKFPSINAPYYNDEADPLKNWALSLSWRGDATYAAMVVKNVLSHIQFYYIGQKSRMEKIFFKLLSSDNGFLSYYPYQFTERTLLARFQINNTYPKYVEFVKKPVYTIFGLLSKLCFNIIPLQITSNGEKINMLNDNFGILATECPKYKQLTIIMYNIKEIHYQNFSTAFHLRINRFERFEDSRWVLLEINNKDTNPFSIWKKYGMPPYPSIHQFSEIKKYEEPRIRGPFKLNASSLWSIHLNLYHPSVSFINVCERQILIKQVKNIRFFRIRNDTLQISWDDDYNRCILSYYVVYSPSEFSSYILINKKKIVYPSYWHTCFAYGSKCQTVGYYKIYAVDYWNRIGPYSKAAYFTQSSYSLL